MKTKKTWAIVMSMALALVLTGAAVAQDEEDAEGCKDHPLLSRMKNFYIDDCRSVFDAVEFYIDEDETATIEGQHTYISYSLKDGVPAPSEFQIKRNYSNAVKSLGGTVLYEDSNCLTMKIVRAGKEIWVGVNTYNQGYIYTLTIVERGEMVQEVTASEMLDALNRDGFMALYIHFDTGKSDIKPESMPVVEEIAALLAANPGLNLIIEGHTDNVGNPQSNKVLSEQRAKAVMDAVIGRGIDASRLSAVGWGQERPVADNRTEEGRAKNRRVEIVKK